MASNTASNNNDSILQRYASATKTRVVTSSRHLHKGERVLPLMLNWCRKRKDIVVLSNGSILTSNPTSRDIQNCKATLISHGIPPGRVFAATQNIVSILLASENSSENQTKNVITEITDRQQHLRSLIIEAIERDVSDIHIEVRANTTKVRMRQHGELNLHTEWSHQLGREIAAVAFNKETDHATSHFNPLIPQDASMPLDLGGRQVRLRLASVPAHGGFDMVMRILANGTESRVPLLTELGYTKGQEKLIADAVREPHGAIIVAGPTGSGKTTTLASCMSLVDEDRKLYSIEDPVEKVVEKATQVPVNTDMDNRSFASMGRAALRMDPDVIILGEMRDEDTSRVMVRAAITGHMVLTTLHTSSAPGIITRLMDLGISPTLLSDSNLLRLLVFQRLIIKLCSHCAISITESEKHKDQLDYWQGVLGSLDGVNARGPGCSHCENSGVSGRTVAAEIIWVDDVGRDYIKKGDVHGWEKYLIEQGWKTYHDHAISLIKHGICDPAITEKMIGKLTDSSKRNSFKYENMAL